MGDTHYTNRTFTKQSPNMIKSHKLVNEGINNIMFNKQQLNLLIVLLINLNQMNTVISNQNIINLINNGSNVPINNIPTRTIITNTSKVPINNITTTISNHNMAVNPQIITSRIVPNNNVISQVPLNPVNRVNQVNPLSVSSQNMNSYINLNTSPAINNGGGILPGTSLMTPQIIPSNNFLPPHMREPSERINLQEFRVLNEIGEGTFGKIYKVLWLVNNKFYALKKEVLKEIDGVKVRQHRNEAIRAFIKNTNCGGIVKLYGNLTIQNGYEFQYFELMELCDKDFEKEIKERSAYNQFYTELELYNIMLQLISTLSFLQKMHITHRDIKPQNILISNGIYKLCDFGDIRVMQREGIVVQRVRGSELYMSPILFKGLRDRVYHVKHNTYKSDVFSLGMVFLFAACLSFDGCVEIREILDMNQKELILNKYLGKRYSPKFIKVLLLMLQSEENNRPDFILLDAAIKQYGL